MSVEELWTEKDRMDYEAEIARLKEKIEDYKDAIKDRVIRLWPVL